MPRPIELAQSVSQIIKQVVDIGERVQKVTKSDVTPNGFLGCLSTELFLIESALKKLPKYAWKPEKVAQLQDPKIASDLDEVLLAIAVIFHEIPVELDCIMSQKAKKFSWKRKDDSARLVIRLRALHSALRLLLTVVSMSPGDEAEQRVEANSTAIEAIHHDRIEYLKQLGMKDQSYPYTSQLLDDPNGDLMATKPSKRKRRPPRLAAELVRYGLDPEHVQGIYDESGLKPWVVTEMFQRIKSYGSEADYRIALATLAHTNRGITFVAEGLAALRDINPQHYSQMLKCVQPWGYDLYRSQQRLTELTAVSLGSGSFTSDFILSGLVPAVTSSDITCIHAGNLSCILKVLEAKGYSFHSVQTDLHRITRVHKELGSHLRRGRYSMNVFGSYVLMRYWKQQAYDTSAMIASLKHTLAIVLELSDTSSLLNTPWSGWSLVIICHLLHRFSYDSGLVTSALERIRAATSNNGILEPSYVVYSRYDCLTILVHARDSLDNQTLVTTLARLAEKFFWFSDQGYLPRLAHHHHYDISRLVELEKIIENAYPPKYVENRRCWEVFEANGYNLQLTLQDAQQVANLGPSVAKPRTPKNKGVDGLPDLAFESQSYTYTIQDGDITWNIAPSVRRTL